MFPGSMGAVLVTGLTAITEKDGGGSLAFGRASCVNASSMTTTHGSTLSAIGADASRRREWLLEHLDSGAYLVTDEVARRLEVSIETIHRDVRILRGLGHPIVGKVGRSGGYLMN